jgi:hypothetical protein
LARNPQLAEAALPDVPFDPASWVNIHLRRSQATGDPLEITLLRPVEWLAAQLAETAALDAEYPQALDGASSARSALEMTDIRSVILSDEVLPQAPGGIAALGANRTQTTSWIFLMLHELAAVGPAEVVRVEPCPPIEPDAGRLVTGTFSHHSGEVLDIAVDGLSEPIGCTGAHPFWSADRQDFIPARDLALGETLRTESGTLRQIIRITPRRGPPVAVFNLEVDVEHVYYVSTAGVLVHNAYPGDVPSRASLRIEYEAEWNRRDFDRKTRALQDLAERGKLRKAPNPVARDPSIPRNHKDALIRRAYDRYGKSDPAKFQSLRARIRQMQPDHVHELQLSGLDEASNLSLLDADVNTGIGRQIWQQTRNLPDGTIIDRIDVGGF